MTETATLTARKAYRKASPSVKLFDMKAGMQMLQYLNLYGNIKSIQRGLSETFVVGRTRRENILMSAMI